MCGYRHREAMQTLKHKCTFRLSSALFVLLAVAGWGQTPFPTSELRIDSNADATYVTLNETELSDLKDLSGSATIGFADGSVGSPSIHWSDDTNTGFYSAQDGRINVASDGVLIGYFDDDAFDFSEPLSMDGTVWLTEGLVLSNLTGLDAATETVVENAIDTLANLSSIGGNAISFGGDVTTGGTFSTGSTFSTTGTFETGGNFATTVAVNMDQDVGTNDEVDFAALTVDTSAWVVPATSGAITTDREIDSSAAGDFASFEVSGTQVISSTREISATRATVDAASGVPLSVILNSGTLPSTGAESIAVLQNNSSASDNGFLTVITGTSGAGGIAIGDSGAYNRFVAQYVNTSDSFLLRTGGGATAVTVDSSGDVVLANDLDVGGDVIITGQIELPGGVLILSGSGSPESAVTAPIGSTFHRTDGSAGTSLYVKESGTGNTGWVAK